MTFKLATPILVLLTLASAPAKAATPAWMCSIFGSYFPGCGPAKPDFQPTFEQGVTVQSPFTGASQPLNPYYFATQATADKVCSLLSGVGCISVYIAPQCDIGGGPVTCSAPERECKFAGRPDKNCGFLAAYWERNPDNLYPGVALQLAINDLGK